MSTHSRFTTSTPSTSSLRAQQAVYSPSGMWGDIPQVPGDSSASGYNLSVPEPVVPHGRSASRMSHPSPFSGSSPGLTFDSRTIISSVDGDEYDPGSWATDEQHHGQDDGGLGLSTGHPWSRQSTDGRRPFYPTSTGGASTGFYADIFYDDEAPEPDPAYGFEAVSATAAGTSYLTRKGTKSTGPGIKPMKLPQNDGKLKTVVKKVARAVRQK
ncbi:hypothetical protein FRC01_014318 [Tulasnella sp. 417]|nr:hypothetical protein FRC01_014318 [Tulasnella sp. 417]